ncbi:MAG TPA: DUF2905 domain-containing protein [Chloroflexi bacterium]|nr:DUF2905 domain-containing protein [Chloroflexota bacterium]
MNVESMGKLLMAIGAATLLLGGLVWLLSKLPFLGQLGHLPGDVRIERPGFSCLVPLTSSILISILLTILLNLVVRLVQFLSQRGPR